MPMSVEEHASTIPVVLLSSTGSTDTQTREVIEADRGHFDVLGLSADGASITELAVQIVALNPAYVGVARDIRKELSAAVESMDGTCPEVFIGENAPIGVVYASVERVAQLYPRATPVVFSGITDGMGLPLTLAILKCGACLALVNKESLVVGGALAKNTVCFPGQIIPTDSKYPTIVQALTSGVHERGLTSSLVPGRSEIVDLVLTTSSGPFCGRTRDQLRDVCAEQASAHLAQQMGPVTTINSSILINKGLGLIGAHLLLDVAPEHIIATVHPQSIVHSMVTQYDDATTLQASPPDMRLSITPGLIWSGRLRDVEELLTWVSASEWTFEPVDNETSPVTNLAHFAVVASATHPAVLNAANEVSVDASITGGVPWFATVDTVANVVHEHESIVDPSSGGIAAVQRWAGQHTREFVCVGQWKDM